MGILDPIVGLSGPMGPSVGFIGSVGVNESIGSNDSVGTNVV